jgi:hypothetical protein
MTLALFACSKKWSNKVSAAENEPLIIVEQFADIKVLRYQIPGQDLTLKKAETTYTTAGTSGVISCGINIINTTQRSELH